MKELLKQPYSVIVLVIGAVFVAGPCVTIDNDYHWSTHAPTTPKLFVPGIGLLILSLIVFGIEIWIKRSRVGTEIGGLDLSKVHEHNGALCTSVAETAVRVTFGRIEEFRADSSVAVILPCNEYFDDKCAYDTRSSLGAFIARAFDNDAPKFVAFVNEQAQRTFPNPTPRRKTSTETAMSYGAGHCLFIRNPLGRSISVALISTTTQRADEGLTARISYLFSGMRELAKRLADERITEVVMPVLGGGLGHLDPPLAFVGLLLAIAEVARYGQGSQRLKTVTIVVFQRDADGTPEVEKIVIQRALALIGSARRN